jgi:quercetin dioxygenase-like cupin family protein
MDDNGFDRRDILKALAVLGFSFTEAQAQTPAENAAKVDPRSYRIVLENDKVRVLEYVSRPRMGVCGTGMHSHPDHVTVTLTEVKARVKLPDGKTFVAENKAGDAFFEPAVTHSVENIGGRDVRSYLIELKKA